MTSLNARSRRGFTLVELLVVIAIIGVLVALLLPALSSARSAANASGSASNMSSFGRGFELYKNSNNGTYTSGAFTHTLDGDARNYGWVADLITLKVAQPGKALDQGNRNKVNLAAADYMGARGSNNDGEYVTGTLGGRWVTATPTAATLALNALLSGSSGAQKEVWDAGNNTNYVTTWSFVRGDPRDTGGYAPGSSGLGDGDGPLSDNHLTQGNTSASRVALMGPGRASAVTVGAAAGASTAAMGDMNTFAGTTIVKLNDVLVDRFTTGMNVANTNITADVPGAGTMIHNFAAIAPLHQPKTAQGTGGHAPLLFADGHVEKVQDTVTTAASGEDTLKGDGFIGNNAAGVIGPEGYQEISAQVWTRRLRTDQISGAQ